MDSKDILQYLAQLERQLIKIYGNTYAAAIEIAEVRKAIENGENFKWSENKAAVAKVDKLLKALIDKVTTLIELANSSRIPSSLANCAIKSKKEANPQPE